MITKEFMDYFVLKFKENYELENKWKEKLFNKDINTEWTALFYDRSKELRDAYVLNEELIYELKDNIPNALSPLEADILYDAIRDLYYSECDDFVILEIIINPLIEYYKKIGDYDKIIFLLHAHAYEETEFYIESNSSSKDKGLEYYYEVFSYQDKYGILDRNSRLTFFKAYNNLIASVLDDVEKDINIYFQIRQRALALWYSNIVQSLDGKDPEFRYYVDRIASNVFMLGDIERLSSDALSILKITYERYNKNSKTPHADFDTTYALKEKIDYSEKKISINELMNVFFNMYDKAIDEFLEENENSSDYIEYANEAIHNIILYSNKDGIKDELKNKALEYVYRHKDWLINLPYRYYTNEINYLIYEFYQASHKMLKTFDEKFNFLSDGIMLRQPVTYIHSIMVKNISERIAKGIFKIKPELFIGIKNTKSVENVINNEDLIMDYIRKAAMLHDVGKLTCVKVINTQNRRLDDREFKIIKAHPENGRKVLCDDPDFNEYYDVILGHHKFYDGSFGYPYDFSNLNSNIKIIIDIVSIADSTDAATDILGRNYTSGKLFIDLLGELKRESNVRYNPEVVDIISNDLELIDDLSKITTSGRLKVYEEVYQRYINMNKR